MNISLDKNILCHVLSWSCTPYTIFHWALSPASKPSTLLVEPLQVARYLQTQEERLLQLKNPQCSQTTCWRRRFESFSVSYFLRSSWLVSVAVWFPGPVHQTSLETALQIDDRWNFELRTTEKNKWEYSFFMVTCSVRTGYVKQNNGGSNFRKPFLRHI